MNILAIRTGIKAVVDSVGLRGYVYMPEVPDTPSVVITTDVDFIDFYQANNAGLAQLNFRLLLIVARQSDDKAQRQLDDYVSGGTPKSLIDAFEADRTLGGSVDDCILRSASSYGPYEGTNLGACVLSLEVLVSRK